jgi:hypothetical protein
MKLLEEYCEETRAIQFLMKKEGFRYRIGVSPQRAQRYAEDRAMIY